VWFAKHEAAHAVVRRDLWAIDRVSADLDGTQAPKV